jgi:hypothetical protein
MIDDTKPAASLAAIHVKRKAAPDAPSIVAVARHAAPSASAAPPAIPDPPPLAVGAAPRRIERRPMAHAAMAATEAEGFLTWRRAGWFGLVYMGALLIFAAALELWPALPR